MTLTKKTKVVRAVKKSGKAVAQWAVKEVKKSTKNYASDEKKSTSQWKAKSKPRPEGYDDTIGGYGNYNSGTFDDPYAGGFAGQRKRGFNPPF